MEIKKYDEVIKSQKERIIEQYGKHIDIINEIFCKKYNRPTKLIENTKLLVYKTPRSRKIPKYEANLQHSQKTITMKLGENNVFWVYDDDDPSIDKIWENLCK